MAASTNYGPIGQPVAVDFRDISIHLLICGNRWHPSGIAVFTVPGLLRGVS